MTREETIKELRKYFNIKELVCRHTFDRFGESAWDFLDTGLLEVLLVLRTKILGVPLVCNSGDSTQRGLRCNMCEMVKGKTSVYLSAHLMGKAVDLTPKGLSAEDARKKIIDNSGKLPCKVRLEDGVSWLHIDVRDNGKDRVIMFKA